MSYVIYYTDRGTPEFYFTGHQPDFMLTSNINASDSYTSLAFWLGADVEVG